MTEPDTSVKSRDEAAPCVACGRPTWSPDGRCHRCRGGAPPAPPPAVDVEPHVPPAVECPRCGYDRSHVAETHAPCSECGYVLEPGALSLSGWSEGERPAVLQAVLAAVLLVMIGRFVFGGIARGQAGEAIFWSGVALFYVVWLVRRVIKFQHGRAARGDVGLVFDREGIHIFGQASTLTAGLGSFAWSTIRSVRAERRGAGVMVRIQRRRPRWWFAPKSIRILVPVPHDRAAGLAAAIDARVRDRGT